MKTFIKSFTDSAKEFRNLRSVVAAALLVALHTIMALFLSIQVTSTLRISISFLANVVIGCLFGPVMGFVCGGVGDLIQFMIKPVGPYFIGWTINAALAGLIYGCFFYGRKPKKMDKNAVEEGRIFNDRNLEKGLNILSSAIAAISVAVLAAAPFIQVMVKGTDEIASKGTAFNELFAGIAGNGSANAMILAGICIVSCVFLFITPWLKWYAPSLIVAVICAFVNILSVYTDKKTTNALWGFWVFVLLFIIYGTIQVVLMARKHSIDLSFMLICIVALIVDTVIVNIFLGTYWCTVMYGKGFAFYFTTRLIKNLVQLPINIVLTYYILGILRKIKRA